MFQQDWILRQIEMIGIVLARLLFGKDKPDYEIVEKEKLSDSDQLYIELIRMLDEGRSMKLKTAFMRSWTPRVCTC